MVTMMLIFINWIILAEACRPHRTYAAYWYRLDIHVGIHVLTATQFLLGKRVRKQANSGCLLSKWITIIRPGRVITKVGIQAELQEAR